MKFQHACATTHDEAYLITFVERPPRADIVAPSTMPLLEAAAESFMWNVSEISCRISLGVVNGWKIICNRQFSQARIFSITAHRCLHTTWWEKYSDRRGPENNAHTLK